MDNVVLNCFLVSTFAGLSTLIGTFPIFLKTKNYQNIIALSLSFAAGVMTSVSVIDLIPSSIKEFSLYYSEIFLCLYLLLFITLGIVLSFIIDKSIPELETKDGKLYKTGLFTMIAIMLHNIPEGITTFMTTSYDFKMGIGLGIAISLHNIPEGVSISIPIYWSTGSKLKSLFYTFISGMGELLGAIITYLFLYQYINNFTMGCVFSIVAGIMVYISLSSLLPSAYKYKKGIKTTLSFIIGFLFMIVSHYIFQ